MARMCFNLKGCIMRFNNFIYKLKSFILSSRLKKKNTNAIDNNVNYVCLVLVNVGLGDAIMATSFIHMLKILGVTTDVITTKKIVPILNNNKDIRSVIVANESKYENKQQYDLVIDPYSHCSWYFTYKYLKVLSYIDYNMVSGFDVKFADKYDDNYIPEDRDIHLTNYYKYILKKYWLESSFPDNYIVNYSDELLVKANSWLSTLPEKTLKVAFCPFASTAERSLSDNQINSILKYFADRNDLSIILLIEKSKVASVEMQNNSYYFESPDFMSAAALVGLCDFIVSVDTSFVHIANSQNKPALVLYSSVYNDGYNTDSLCGPNYNNARQIVEASGVATMPAELIYGYIKDELSKLTIVHI